jgi:phosphoribosyl-ATP pyrophosphohydrolase
LNTFSFLDELEKIIEDRLRNPKESSYTNLLAQKGVPKIAKKLGEEGVEVSLAGVCENDKRLTSEAADLIYHLLVLLAVRGISFSDVVDELRKRNKS